MKQTAIKKLIEEMESLASTQEYAMPSKAIRECIYLAYAKLPIEKQQIVDAHTAGMIIALKTGDDEDFRLSFNECAEQYFENTFKI